MTDNAIQQAERRRETRSADGGAIRASRTMPCLPISDAQVLNVSPHGIAIATRVPLRAGARLSFAPAAHLPPILAEVLASERIGGEEFRVRCRCLLGSFDVAAGA